jgi:hypothetical protein
MTPRLTGPENGEADGYSWIDEHLQKLHDIPKYYAIYISNSAI